jgi:WD40 repeat protein
LSVALSADGKQLVTGSRDQPTILWEAATGKKLQTIGHSNFRSALSADGNHVVTADSDGATLWETATGKQLQTFHHTMIFCVALSANGKKVLTVGLDPVFLWAAASGERLGTFQVHQKGEDSWVTCLALSVQGDQILTGSFEGTTILWETATGKKLHTFQGHTRMVSSVAFSANGRHAWSSSHDGTTRLWDTKSGKELCSLLIFEGGKDWLVVTPAGFFDGSPGGWKRLSFRDTGTAKVLEDGATKKKFYRPGLLGALCRGERLNP